MIEDKQKYNSIWENITEMGDRIGTLLNFDDTKRGAMQLNYLGLVSALAAFLNIWWGHVAVRKIESVALRLWPPMLIFIVLGIGAETVAVLSDNVYLSAAFGIAGVVFLWDAFEFHRQQKRVKRGHAPANPDNPRHARILADHSTASFIDWLDRDPRGRAYAAEELAEIGKGAK